VTGAATARMCLLKTNLGKVKRGVNEKVIKKKKKMMRKNSLDVNRKSETRREKKNLENLFTKTLEFLVEAQFAITDAETFTPPICVPRVLQSHSPLSLDIHTIFVS
jgi:hypothetical protein